MVNVKGYLGLNRILVQYYDSGERDWLSCPFCPWEGEAPKSAKPAESYPTEVCCPRCTTKLAVISSSMQTPETRALSVAASV